MVHVFLHVLCMFAEGASALSLAALRMVSPPRAGPLGLGGRFRSCDGLGWSTHGILGTLTPPTPSSTLVLSHYNNNEPRVTDTCISHRTHFWSFDAPPQSHVHQTALLSCVLEIAISLSLVLLLAE